jgi:hypothetical protein
MCDIVTSGDSGVGADRTAPTDAGEKVIDYGAK